MAVNPAIHAPDTAVVRIWPDPKDTCNNFIVHVKVIDRNTGEPKPCNISLFKLNPDSTYRFQEDDETAKGLGKIVFSDTIPPHNTYFLKVEPG